MSNRLAGQSSGGTTLLPFLFHSSFDVPGAGDEFARDPIYDESLGYMPDEVTREFAKRMHYSAWRVSKAKTRREITHWRQRYFNYRDCIVLGNQKLTFRAVQKWRFASYFAEDMSAECQIVLIKAVAAYSPWLGVRFSTYAVTCLMRALSRLSQRRAADLSRSMPIEALPTGEPCDPHDEDQAAPSFEWLSDYLKHDDLLLTPREKMVLTLRFHLDENAPRLETLEQVGRNIGLSKERVRQVQNTALGKLRVALSSVTNGL